MKIFGVCRIRNEQDIIESTLSHVSGLVDEIYVYDDHSIDQTIEICKYFDKVKRIIRSKSWEPDPRKRQTLEGTQRQRIFLEAFKNNPDWIYYFDADEYADFDGVDFENKQVGAYKMRLFDFYITPEDRTHHYLDRKFIGPEFRDILTLFRPTVRTRFGSRVPSGFSGCVKTGGFIKHYGKAISVQQWEETCDYYINHLFEKQPGNSTISQKWTDRKGKAVHNGISDFGRPLITWKDRHNDKLIIDNSRGEAE